MYGSFVKFMRKELDECAYKTDDARVQKALNRIEPLLPIRNMPDVKYEKSDYIGNYYDYTLKISNWAKKYNGYVVRMIGRYIYDDILRSKRMQFHKVRDFNWKGHRGRAFMESFQDAVELKDYRYNNKRLLEAFDEII